MNKSELPKWTNQARGLLDASAQALDAATQSRLNRARQAALAQAAPRRRAGWTLLPAGLAGACALLVAVGVWHARSPTSAPISAPTAASVAAPVATAPAAKAGDDNLEMVQDIDFYAWLDAQDQGEGG